MNERHIIEKTTWHIAFGSEEDAFEQQAALSAYAGNRMLATVDEVFGEMSSAGQVFRIDRLEVDLGAVAYHDYQQELDQRLRERLRDALHAKLQALKVAPAPNEGVITRQNAELAQIEYFLTNGRLPWNADPGDGGNPSIDQMLQGVLQANGARFVQYLKSSSHRATIIRRLVRQFPDPILDEIVRALDLEKRAGLNPELIDILQALLETERAEHRPMPAIIPSVAARGQGNYPPTTPDAAAEALSAAAASESAPVTYLRRQLAKALKRGNSRGITYFWHTLLRDRPRLLKETLRYYGRRAEIRKKIATGFPASMLKDIVHLLEPAASSFIEAVVDRPQLFQQACTKPPEEPDGTKRRLWEFTLTYLLVERGSRFNKKAYMRSLMQQMAAHNNIRYGDLLSSLTDVLEKIAVPNALKNELLELLGDLTGELDNRSMPAGSGQAADISYPAQVDFLRNRLADAILSGSVRGIQEHWPTLLNEQSDLLESALRHYGRQAELRKKVAQGFSESMLRDSVHLLEPAAGSFIEETLARPQLFRPAGGRSPDQIGSLKRQLWEFTLAYLLAERGSRFNKKVYMGSLVQKMASHDNLRSRDLLFAMTRMLQKMEAPNPFKQELLQLLAGLADEMGGPPQDPPDPASQSRQVIRAYDLFEGLKRYWQPDNLAAPGSAGDPAKILDELARAYPEQLLRLYRELQSGQLSLRIVAARLPVEALHRLLAAFMALTRSDGRDQSNDFLHAVETFAGRAPKQRRFYRQVLEHVISDQIVDLEKILAQNRPAPAKDGPAEAPPITGGVPQTQKLPAGPTKDTVPVGDRALDALAAYLKGDRGADSAAKAGLIHMFELLIVQQPAGLRRLLADVPGRPEAAARIIDLLPERLLTRLLFLTHSAEHYRVQQAADAITNACCFKEFGITCDRLHRLKWQFIFKFLFEKSRPVDETAFVQRFAAYLAPQSDFADIAEFQSHLIGRLRHNSLPVNRQHHLRLIDALSLTTVQTLQSEPDLQTIELPDGAVSAEDEEQAFSEEIYIDNAGLVLTSPYLPRLFATLELTAKFAFKNRASAERAVHLLQFMVNAGTDTPEFQLVLNKILCGVKTGTPIAREIDISAREQKTLEGLLQAMIANWKSIGKTSVAGLRESFLQREGWLRRKDDAWHLLVEPRAYDMLLDRLPWGFTTIKHPWMERVVYVKWR